MQAYRTNATDDRDREAAAEEREIAAVDLDARGRRRRAAFVVGSGAAGLVAIAGLAPAIHEATRRPELHCHNVSVVYENRPELPPDTRLQCAWR